MSSPSTPDGVGDDGHAGPLLSAHVDGELSAVEEHWVEGHLAECPPCRAMADAVARTRDAVRGLPSAPGQSFVDGLLARHRRTVRMGAGLVACSAVALVVVAVATAPSAPDVEPDIAELHAMHRHLGEGHVDVGADTDGRTAAGRTDDAVDGDGAEMPPMEPVEAVGRNYAAPGGMIGSAARLSRRALYDGADMTAVVYAGDGVAVTVFQQPGSLVWSSLPEGDDHDLGGRRVWVGAGAAGEPVVAVGEFGDLVVSAVSDDHAAALTALGGMPDARRRSGWDRLHDACQKATDAFALAG